MLTGYEMKIIARIYTGFPEKFGLPRQSGVVGSLCGRVIFEPEYRDTSAVRGLEGFSHIWLIWGFSAAQRDTWSPTVRPPRLGGNKRVGVFATRSPFRPNPIGLSVVSLDRIVLDEKLGAVLEVSGIDMMDGTPIYDIKPYLSYADSRPDAADGFAGAVSFTHIEVDLPENLCAGVPDEIKNSLREVLAQDPRPHYQNDPERIYGFPFSGYEVKFRVENGKAILVSLAKIDK